MAVERLTDYTRRIWTGLSADGPDPDMQAGDVIYYMDTSTCSIITGIPAPGSIDTEDLPNIGGGGSSEDTLTKALNNTLTSFTWTGTTANRANLFSFVGSNMQEMNFPNLTTIGPALNVFTNCSAKIINVPKVTSITRYGFSACTGITTMVLPKWTSAPSSNFDNIFSGCTNLTAIDIGANVAKAGSNGTYQGCTKLATMILRSSSVRPLGSTAAFTNTPFASGKAGGTLYVPSALIESYQNATNWSTILAYANNQIQPIEGSIYETQYADGTPIH